MLMASSTSCGLPSVQMSSCLSSAKNISPLHAYDHDRLSERNLKILAFVPCINSTPQCRDIFVHPAIMLAEQYINNGCPVCLGDQIHSLRVNITVDYVEIGVSQLQYVSM
jgi:hypothetical protein